MGERPSKKQHELLSFISEFIKTHGYGPSYREVMRALEYKSVSTVAVHVDGLIARGFVRKKDRSARSLEVIGGPDDETSPHIKWLNREVAKREQAVEEVAKRELIVLQEALAIVTRGQLEQNDKGS